MILNDGTTIFIDVHNKHQKTLCFSVVSHPAEPQVSIFIAKVKTWLRKHAKSTVFFNFSNHARAQVPIFTPKIKKLEFARLARLSTRKWDFRRRSRPRELAQRSQDDVSLNKLPQISRKKSSLPHLGPSQAIFSMDRKNQKNDVEAYRQNIAWLEFQREVLFHVSGHLVISYC